MASVIETRKTRLLLLGLVLAHLVAISKQVERGGQSLLGQGLFALVTPLQAVITGTIRGVSGGWAGYVDLRRVYEQNRSLQERVRVLESHLQARQEQAQEAERLREMLQLKKELPLGVLAAEVIVREGAPWARTITLDKGSADGGVGDVAVTSGLDHLYPAGLVVGRVRSAARGNGLFREILVTPSAQFYTLEEVLVVRTPIPDDTMTQCVR